MADLTGLNLKRLRKKPKHGLDKDKRTKLAKRIIELAERDKQERQVDFDNRLQRHAKLRQWTTGKTFPWPDSSDVAIPDLATISLRYQDTLHNAVMSQRPVVNAKAGRREYKDREENVDRCLDFQFFIEQSGEKVIEELALEFVDEGVFTAYIPWVKEDKKFCDTREFAPIPDDVLPREYFVRIIDSKYPKSDIVQKDKEGWDWEVTTADNPKPVYIKFYAYKDRTEMYIDETVRVFDGPKVIVKDYRDVLYPHRSANLQPPGPSNPGGASHVTLVDYPTIDEIEKLCEGDDYSEAYYDLPDEEDKAGFKNLSQDRSDDSKEDQKDALQGTNETKENDREDYRHNRVTRYMIFDIYDIDDNGKPIDCVFWVLKEANLLLKAKKLTEMFPMRPPRRPLAEATFIPVKGRRAGISALELAEGLHDLKKTLIDLMIDAGTLQSIPFGFYKPQSSIKPDVYRLYPGDLMPLNNPQSDVNMPNLNNNAMTFGMNTYALADQMEEKLTVVGDLQMGRVPRGKATALRTAEGIQTILGQGEARPERILRRFFMGLCDIFKIMHSLNRNFLVGKKKFRIYGYSTDGSDPYKEIAPDDFDGDYQFGFNANILNSSKAAMQESLMALTPQIVNPLTLQMGFMSARKMYKLLSDTIKAYGQHPDDYLEKPGGVSDKTITAEEAIAIIMDSEMPFGTPLEGFQLHIQKLQLFQQSDKFGFLTQYQVQIFNIYLQQVFMAAQVAMQQQKILQAAEGFGEKEGTKGKPKNNGAMDTGQPMVNSGELIDESLPGAQGRE